MTDIPDRYISKGGRLPGYDRTAFVDDLNTVATFLVWAEDDRAFYAGHKASDAFKAMCRLMDFDSVQLRKIAKGE